VRRGPTYIDELVAKILPRAPVPRHLSPRHLLDESVVPPASVAEKVLALRALVKSGGRAEDLLGSRIATSADVAAYFVPLLRGDTMESLHVLGLDSKNAVRFAQCVCRGGIASCAVVPRDLLRPVIINACPAMIITHNHPSGSPRPSAEDSAFTEQLARAAEVVGVRLLDHVVVGGDAHFSFLDAGLLPARRA
jgi:DNA repair protein RadC